MAAAAHTSDNNSVTHFLGLAVAHADACLKMGSSCFDGHTPTQRRRSNDGPCQQRWSAAAAVDLEAGSMALAAQSAHPRGCPRRAWRQPCSMSGGCH